MGSPTYLLAAALVSPMGPPNKPVVPTGNARPQHTARASGLRTMFVATQYKIAGTPDSVPEVVHVSYDLWRLQITVVFEGQSQAVYLSFNSVGFRVLDEGQLLDYWGKEERAPGWLWRMESGGWFDQESQRSGFLMGAFAGEGDRRPNEYLLLGINDCVSILSWGEPQVLLAEP